MPLHRASCDRRAEAVDLADLGTTLAEAGHPVIARSIWRIAFVMLTGFRPRAGGAGPPGPHRGEVVAERSPWHAWGSIENVLWLPGSTELEDAGHSTNARSAA
ncbi:hypothetical protein [Amycolatopsis sp. WAC 01375]|uniref:hypothetical protein n=1 Tax=Amycolatopsis sp. WAC 01375 TaxID=2203194 RepID=UPI000F7AABD6|nr:hypothetical protein [Amycolatopsis sp. WAC 01375]